MCNYKIIKLWKININLFYPFDNIFDVCSCELFILFPTSSFEFGSLTDTQNLVIAAAALNNFAVLCLSIFFFH